MIIRDRTIGDVTILDLVGAISLGGGDEEIRDYVRHLVGQGRTKVVFNMAKVPYIDSSGSGEIVGCYTAISIGGGKLKMLKPTKRIRDLWAVQGLIVLYEIFEDEAEALASFGVDGFLSACPVCGFNAAFTTIRASTQTCTSCAAEFVFASQAAEGAREVELIMLSTYDGERVSLRTGWPYELSLQGRLDLFAAEGLEEAWRTVPPPRRVLIDLGAECRVITPRGLRALAELCQPETDGGRTVAWLHDGAQERVAAAAYGGPFFRERSVALAALEIGDLQPIPIRVEAAPT